MKKIAANDTWHGINGAVVLFQRARHGEFYRHMVNGGDHKSVRRRLKVLANRLQHALIVDHWREDQHWAALVLDHSLPSTGPGAEFNRIEASDDRGSYEDDDEAPARYQPTAAEATDRFSATGPAASAAAAVYVWDWPTKGADESEASVADAPSPPPASEWTTGVAESANDRLDAEDAYELCAWAAKNSPIVAACAQRLDLNDDVQKTLAIGLLAKENERLTRELLENTPAMIFSNKQEVWPEPQRHLTPAQGHLLDNSLGDHVVEFNGVCVFDSREVEVRDGQVFRKPPLADFKQHASYKMGEIIDVGDGRFGVATPDGFAGRFAAELAKRGTQRVAGEGDKAMQPDFGWVAEDANNKFWAAFDMAGEPGASASPEASVAEPSPPAAPAGELPDSTDGAGKSWRDRGSLL